MKYLKPFNENHFTNIEPSDDEKRQICINRGMCPVCGAYFVESDEGEEGEYRYSVCPNNKQHYHKYLGLGEDLDEE